MPRSRAYLSIFLFLLGWSQTVFSQLDSNYLISYSHQMTGRFYFSQKETAFQFRDQSTGSFISYKPNTTFNMGVGATYRWATLNLAYGFNFLNPERGQGETKYLDLQGHVYGLKWQVDFLAQFYNGFFLDNDYRNQDGDYYQRADIKVREYGMTVQYLPNHKRFSYRAGFLQNDWQIKSAGTPILGMQWLFGNGRSDSAFVPGFLRDTFQFGPAQSVRFFEIGPVAGYAYTLVIKKHFFFMGSLHATLEYVDNRVLGAFGKGSDKVTPNIGFKGALGYNSDKWAVVVNYYNDAAHLNDRNSGNAFSLTTANIRFNLVRRFVYRGPKLPIIDWL